MVTLSIRIWCQACSHPWKQDDPIWCTVMTPRLHTRWRQWQWRHCHAPWQLVYQSNLFGFTRLNNGLQRYGQRSNRCTSAITGTRTYSITMKWVEGLDIGENQQQECPFLQREKLHTKRHELTKRHFKDVPWTWDSRTSWRTWDL